MQPILRGSHPVYGRVAAVGVLSGERYYWFIDRHGAVSMMPATDVESHIRRQDQAQEEREDA